MFEDYIRAKRSYDSRRSGEAERWLTLYHVDLSDEWIKPMVQGKARIMLGFVDEKNKKKQTWIVRMTSHDGKERKI